MTVRFRNLLLLSSLVWLPALPAQETSSAWTGEWGHYQSLHSEKWPFYSGQRLLLTDCTASSCELKVSVVGPQGNGDASGTLQFQSPSTAIAHLSASGAEKCTLALTLSAKPAERSITVSSNNTDCSYFLTPSASFNHTYPFRTASQYYGDDIAACYTSTAPAQTALCSNADLIALQKQWVTRSYQVTGVEGTRFNEQPAQSAITSKCGSDPNPVSCLHNTYQQSIAGLNRREQTWLKTVTTPGDPQEAASKAASISGHYRHSFPNGDVQGDNFTSTDTLRIAKASNDSIRYSLSLNFYNGHMCGRKGTALYKQNGFFVDRTQNYDGSTCYFEIIPGESGITLGDPTGACRLQDCGARGGYTHASFSYSQRIKEAPRAAREIATPPGK